MKPLKILSFLCIVCIAALNSAAQTSGLTKYTKVTNGYVMVLRQGDSLFFHLEQLALAEKIPFAHFTGFGFANVTFGFFNTETKQFEPKYFENLEMGVVTGSIARQKGKPSLHIHGTGSDRNFNAFGGHILSAVVSTGSLELFITVTNKKFERIKEEELGANVLEVK